MLDLDRAAVVPTYADLTDYKKFNVGKLFPADDIDYQMWHILRCLNFLSLHKFHKVGIIRENEDEELWEEIHSGKYTKVEL